MPQPPARVLVSALAVAPALLMAAACSGADATARRPQVPATADPLSAPVVTAGVGEVIAQLDPPPSGSVSLPWKLDGRSADGSRLYVTYVAGDDDCVRFAGFTLSGSAQVLQLQAVGAVDASKTACASRLEQGRGVLVLPEALGDRQLVHGPVSPDWANGLAG